ncbi:phage tail assembly chaperone [Pikeienuella piscinae]|uniref:Phage tail assembly chaperone n=2 Tax=Pikeienuella piscinae TaxID=2748098 RepID=A0A7M3T6V1_9RHOB|nr:phage tail assembly chaperone [Pikeienuella piscinae]
MLMRFGLGALGLGPREFWTMTPREFDAAAKGRLGLFNDARALDRAGLAALNEKFPDRAAS